MPTAKKTRSAYARKSFDVDDPEERMEAYSWMIEAAWLFRDAFR